MLFCACVVEIEQFLKIDIYICIYFTFLSFRRVPVQRPSKLSGAAGLSPGGGQHFAHILQTLEGLLIFSVFNVEFLENLLNLLLVFHCYDNSFFDYLRCFPQNLSSIFCREVEVVAICHYRKRPKETER